MGCNWCGVVNGVRWVTAGPDGNGRVVAVARGRLRPRQCVSVEFTCDEWPGEVLRANLTVAGMSGVEAVGVGVVGD